jgi:hypothetical protein
MHTSSWNAACSVVVATNASLYTPAPNVMLCCSDSKQLELRLTPEGQPYLHQESSWNWAANAQEVKQP